MKYLIILIVIGLAIWGFVQLTNMNVSVSLDSDNTEETINSEANEYISKFRENVQLPNKKIFVWPASTNFSVSNGINICEENAYISVQITKDEFFGLINQLGLEKSPDLFEFWPEAFFDEDLVRNEWDVTKIPNEYTYYAANPIVQIEMAARYENNKIFIRTKAKVELIGDDYGKEIGSRVIER